jgi:hypothetical protein
MTLQGISYLLQPTCQEGARDMEGEQQRYKRAHARVQALKGDYT